CALPISDMVVAAGVHAAGNVQAQIAQVIEIVEIVELPLDGFGDGDRLGVGQGAEVAPRTADDVSQGADGGSGETQRPQFPPQLVQGAAADVGQHLVLAEGDPDVAVVLA